MMCKTCKRAHNPVLHAHFLRSERMRRWRRKERANGSWCHTCKGPCGDKHEAKAKILAASRARWLGKHQGYVTPSRRTAVAVEEPPHPLILQAREAVGRNDDVVQEFLLARVEGRDITSVEARHRAHHGDYVLSLESTADVFGNTAADRS